MRLHHLRLEAFGPFPGVEEIDFDTLGQQGIHLIHGPTGAGKSSILDAICFALFGQVPGARRGGSLRSDHAGADATPSVTLEATIAGRRLRIERSPEHQAPKKRGSGTTKRQAKVVLSERTAGGWDGISTRNDEVGDAITQALGMGLEQFAQVVLLPQGQFAAFLQAKPDERGKVLRRLFDIERYVDLEEWLAAARRDAGAAAERARTAVTTSLVRLQTVLSDVPEVRDEGQAETQHGSEPSSDDGDHRDEPAPAWTDLPLAEVTVAVGQEQARLSVLVDAAMAESERLDAASAEAAAALVSARRTVQLRLEGEAATSELAALESQATAETSARAELAAARRAAQVRASHQAARRAQQQAQEAASRLADAAEALLEAAPWLMTETGQDAAPDGPTQSPTAAVEPDLQQRCENGSRLLRDAGASLADVQRVQQRLTATIARLDTAAVALGECRATLAAEQAQVEALTDAHEPQRSPADDLEDAQSHCALVARAVTGAEAIRNLLTERERAEAARRTAVEQFQKAEDAVLRLRRARLDNLAATLAQGLVPDTSCPVCGSLEHPAPALAGTDDVTQDQVDAAEERAAAAAESLSAGRAELAAVQARYAGSRERLAELLSESLPTAGDGPGGSEAGRLARRLGESAADPDEMTQLDDLAAVLVTLSEEAQQRRSVAQRAAQEAERRAEQLRGASAAVARAESMREQLEREHAVHTAAVEQGRADLRDHAARLATRTQQHLAGCPCCEPGAPEAKPIDELIERCAQADGDPARLQVLVSEVGRELTAQLDRHRATAALVSAATAARHTADAAAQNAGQAAEDLHLLLDQHGFDSAESADDAWRPDERTGHLEDWLRSRDRTRERVLALLERPEVGSALAADLPDLQDCQRQADRSAEAARRAHTVMTTMQRAHERLREIAGELSAAVRELEPLQARLSGISALADTVAGGGDNLKRMRLSSYVLAARLEEVTHLANERLTVMTDGRYMLAHSDEKVKGGLRSGLGLVVRDAWTGRTRDTATLSGGESFLASLALALGLGDAVRQDAGGLELQTLFVDEGFGTLDEATLEQVMQVLDELRAGGRSVGIVSHVGELRHRLPAQIEVLKSESGSSLRVLVAGASAA